MEPFSCDLRISWTGTESFDGEPTPPRAEIKQEAAGDRRPPLRQCDPSSRASQVRNLILQILRGYAEFFKPQHTCPQDVVVPKKIHLGDSQWCSREALENPRERRSERKRDKNETTGAPLAGKNQVEDLTECVGFRPC